MEDVPQTRYNFPGKKALVTGAGKGIGLAIAKALHEAGCHVAAISRTASDLDDLSELLGGDRIVTASADMSDAGAMEAAVLRCVEEMQGIDFLVNNAGVALNAPLLEASVEDFQRTLQVNLVAAFVATQIVGRTMIEQGGGGAIVNVSSQCGSVAFPSHAAYCCSKAGMDMLSKMTSLELGPYGIRCNSVSPTVVLTRMGRENWADNARAMPLLDRTPLGRLAEVREVVEPVLFLLSDSAGMISGGVVPLEGGLLSSCTLRTTPIQTSVCEPPPESHRTDGSQMAGSQPPLGSHRSMGSQLPPASQRTTGSLQPPGSHG